MVRDGRWFWWVVLACAAVIAGDLAGYGPFDDGDGARVETEVLGDNVERESFVTTTPTAPPPPTSVSEDEQLEMLDGLDQETLDALEELRGLEPEDLPATTVPADDSSGGPGREGEAD